MEVPLQPTALSPHFVDAWSDHQERNLFWRWLIDDPEARSQDRVLVNVYSMMLSMSGDVVDSSSNPSLVNSLEELSAYLRGQGSEGVVPSVSAAIVAELDALLAPLRTGERRLEEWQPEEIEAFDSNVSSLVNTLNAEVINRLESLYQKFREKTLDDTAV